HDIERPLLAPSRLFLAPDEVRQHLNGIAQVLCFGAAAPEAPTARAVSHAVASLPDLSFDPHLDPPSGRLEQFLKNFDGRALLIAETAGRREALLERLYKRGIRPEPVERWQDFLDGKAKLGLAIGVLERGALLESLGLALIPEA